MTAAVCAMCEQEPATVKLTYTYVCPACEVVMREEADRRLRLIVEALREENGKREDTAA